MSKIGKVFYNLISSSKKSSKIKTKVYPDSSGNVVRMVRPIMRNGVEATATWMKNGNNKSKMIIEGGGTKLWRSK